MTTEQNKAVIATLNRQIEELIKEAHDLENEALKWDSFRAQGFFYAAQEKLKKAGELQEVINSMY